MMLIAIATGTGLRREIQQKIASLNGHIQIFYYDTNRSQVSVNPIDIEQDFYPNWNDFFNNQAEKSSFDRAKITHIQPIINKAGIVRTAQTFEGIIAKGVDKNYHWKFIETYLKEGKIPNFSTDEISDEVLISSYLANRLELKIGDNCNTLFLNDTQQTKIPNQRNFKIVGIYESGFYEFDQLFVFVDMRHLQKINKWSAHQIGAFEVFIDDFEKMELTNLFIHQSISTFLDSESIADKYATIFEWFGAFDINIFIIIAIMILVGGTNMITAILTLILEKTPMIGLLKSLGATNWSVRKIFLYNAAFLILLGLFLGNFLGLGLLFIQKYFGLLKLNPAVYYVSEVSVYLNIWHIVLLNLGVLFLCLLMLVIPSYIIVKISPVKSMKWE